MAYYVLRMTGAAKFYKINGFDLRPKTGEGVDPPRVRSRGWGSVDGACVRGIRARSWSFAVSPGSEHIAASRQTIIITGLLAHARTPTHQTAARCETDIWIIAV